MPINGHACSIFCSPIGESRGAERAAQILNTVAETHVMASVDAKFKSSRLGRLS
jgi:hypothetical protein